MISCPCPAVVIRFIGGSSGRFLAMLIHNFCHTTPLLPDPIYAHRNNSISQFHNIDSINYSLLHSYTNRLIDSTVADRFDEYQKWFESQFKINYYLKPKILTIWGHFVDPSIITTSIENCRLITIGFTKNDIDQIVYNSIYKNIVKDKRQHLLDKIVNGFKMVMPEEYKNIVSITGNITLNTDIKILCAMEKFIAEDYNFDFMNLTPHYHVPSYIFPFGNIANKQIINQLDELADFLGVQLTEERRKNCIALVNQYADAQIPVPWAIDVDKIFNNLDNVLRPPPSKIIQPAPIARHF
jgi:hypothetical protein